MQHLQHLVPGTSYTINEHSIAFLYVLASSMIICIYIFRDRSGGMASSRVGSSKENSIRHASNRPMSNSPSRLAGESHYQPRSANYNNQQQGGDSNLAASGSSSVADGVYSNKRLMHACTCLIGTTVQVIL